MQPKFSLIIPTIKATDLVATCINSIFEFERRRELFEIIVVDDGSTKEVQSWLFDFCAKNGVRFFAKGSNKGFAHSVNIGLKEAVGEYRILVNNDIIWTRPILDEVEAAFKVHPDIGIVGAKLLYPDGRVQHAGVVRSPNSMSFNHINKFMPSTHAQVNQSKYFLSVTGALFAIRKAAQEKIGLFNENYFIACEDCEYCVRAWVNGVRVYYSHKVEAIHAEGYTRGNDHASKLKKGPEWFKREMETFTKFWQDMAKVNLNGIDATVMQLNAGVVANESVKPSVAVEKKKLEIGCGYNPQPGYLHLDVRPLPHVEYVCNFAEQKLPFADGELGEIINNHVIEHVSWRKLPFVLSEWRRALTPGGRLFLRTPDLEFICRAYLDGKTTPEWPDDEKYVKQFLNDTVTPAWWANIKLFAGQDYPANFHLHCFDFPMLKALLERYGFERVTRLEIQPVYSPGELQVEAFRAGVDIQNVSRKTTKALIKRRGALGDTLLTTPIAARLRAELGADAEIVVATDCGTAYVNNPHVNTVVPGNHSPQGYDRVIDLDLAYERNPKMHIVDAYSQQAFGDVNYDKSLVFQVTDQDKVIAAQHIMEAHADPNKSIVIHAAVSWRNRTWSKENWVELGRLLNVKEYVVFVVGSGNDMAWAENRVVDLTRKLSLHQIAALIAQSKCFVGSDSSMIHIAGTTETPIVGLFTCAKAEYRLPYRNGAYGHNCEAVAPDLPCYGCLHTEPAPVVFCDCRRGDFACLAQLTPDRVVQAVERILCPQQL